MNASLNAVSGLFLLLSAGALVIKTESDRPVHAVPGVPVAGYAEALRWGADSLRSRPAGWEDALQLGWGHAPEGLDAYMENAAPVLDALSRASAGSPANLANAEARVLWSFGGLLGLEAQRLADRGTFDGALDAIQIGFQIAEHARIAGGMTSIAHFQTSPIELDMHTVLACILRSGNFSADSLHSILHALSEMRAERPNIRVLLEADATDLETLLRTHWQDAPGGQPADFELMQEHFETQHSGMLDALEEGVRTGALQSFQERFQSLEDRLESLEAPVSQADREAVRTMRVEVTADVALLMVLEGVERNVDLVLWYDARFDLARVGLALKAYRVRHGAWPLTLGELVPEFIPELPLDPFAPRALRETFTWEPDHAPARLYSLGPDRIHNGGKKKAQKPNEPGDLVLSL